MLKSYFILALRNLRRQQGFTFINIVGLALGVATCLLIGLYVQDELSYDRFHEQGDRIYRINQRVVEPEGTETWAWVGGALAEDLRQDVSSFEAVVRLLPDEMVIRYEPPEGPVRSFREPNVAFADPALWDVFTLPFQQGDPATAFAEPASIVLTASMAAKYFGEAEPLGQVLSLYDGALPLTVTGVIEDLPRTSHFRYDFFAPVAAFKQMQGMALDAAFGSYWWPFTYTYVLMPDAEAARQLEAQLPAFIQRHREQRPSQRFIPTLEPLYDIHLQSEATAGPSVGGSLALVRIFLGIALAVLLLACINFMNLATARSSKRAREVGVRKSVGAHRGQLIRQFLGESVLMSLVALLLAIGLVELALPFFNELAGRTITVNYAANTGYWLGLLGLVVFTGVAAGLYPALYLSRFRPAQVLKGTFSRQGGSAALRKGLIVFQFTVSIALIAGTAIAAAQLRYMQHARLGFDEDQIVVARLQAGDDWDQLQQALRSEGFVVDVTSTTMRPGLGLSSSLPYRIGPAGGDATTNAGDIGIQYVDYNFFDLMDLDLVAGRGFAPDRRSDVGVVPEDTEWLHVYDRGFVVNEATLRANGWTREEALGKQIRAYALENGTYYTDLRGTVVGVVEDYHHSSFHSTIRPMLFQLAERPDSFTATWALVKVAPGNAGAALDRMENLWKRAAPESPFEASFLDQDLQTLYVQEAQLGTVIGAFSFIGIVIACLGLFGLAAYAAEQRTKEIGIRKVMGASVPGILLLLSRDFVMLVLSAALVAAPLAWFTMDRWLADFAYRIDLHAGFFVAAAALALLIALATVSYQAFKAARINPTEALRYE